MQIVPSTALALILLIVLMIRGPYRGLPALMAATPLGVAAAFNLPAAGGASIMVVDMGVAAAFGLMLLQPDSPARVLGSMRPFQPGFYLALMILFATFTAVIFPRIFAGDTQVFGIARSNNTLGIISIPLHATTGNLTQLFRIFLDGMAFFTFATLFREWPDAGPVLRAVAVAAWVNVALGWIDVLTFDLHLGAVMKLIQTANYAILDDVAMAGMKRMIGGFSEASSFGYYTLGLFGFWLQYRLRGGRARGSGWAFAMTTLVLLRSTSSSAYVSMLAFVLVAGGVALARQLGRSVERRLLGTLVWGLVVLWLAALALGAAYVLLDPVQAFLNRALFDKLATASGVERMAWNMQALKNFTDTWMMGAGLGSMRASNWLLACLGSIGLVGTGLFLGFLATLFALPRPDGDTERTATIEGLQGGCLAMFISAMLTQPTPDLGIFFFLLAGLATGLSRGAVLESLGAAKWRIGSGIRGNGRVRPGL